MIKRIVLAALAGLTLAGLALAGPARAETESAACIVAIRSATVHHRAQGVPADCWRIGPLRLGMSRVSIEGLLGGPDTARNLAITYRKRKFPLAEGFYVYPRNLKSWLRLAPQQAFHPITLHLIYWKDDLVAVAVGATARIDEQSCTPSVAARPFQRGGVDFPYDFHGIALGGPLSAVTQRFGRFAGVNASHDFSNYWPVPLSFDGETRVEQMAFSTGMAFAGVAGMPDFHVRRDPRTCLAKGFTLSPPP